MAIDSYEIGKIIKKTMMIGAKIGRSKTIRIRITAAVGNVLKVMISGRMKFAKLLLMPEITPKNDPMTKAIAKLMTNLNKVPPTASHVEA